MPLPTADARPSNPLYVLASGQAIAASGTFNSPSVCCEDKDAAILLYSIDQIHNRDIQVSDDDVTWYTIGTGGLISSQTSATGVSAGVNRALIFPLGGARFVRISIANTAASAATLNAKLMVR